MSEATQPSMARGSARWITGLCVLAVAFLALVTGAKAATTVTSAVSGSQVGSPGLPQPVIATLNTTVDNAGGIPVAQTQTLVQTFPSEFINNLASFGTCPESSFDDPETPAGGAEDPTVSCPSNSIVGSGSFKSYAPIPGDPLVVESTKAVIVRDANTGGLAFWTTYDVGGAVSTFAHGTVAGNANGQTIVVWDVFTEGLQPSDFFPVALLEFNTTYNDALPSLQPLEPFSNTGCAAGTWTFTVDNVFVGGAPTQTIPAVSSCTTLAPPLSGSPAIVTKGKVKISSMGKGWVKLTCNAVGPCSGDFAVRPQAKGGKKKKGTKKPPIGKGSYQLEANQTKWVNFTLDNRGEKILANRTKNKNGKLWVKFRLIPTSGLAVARNLALINRK